MRRVPWWSGAIGLYAVLTLLTAASWEPSHDEGVTWDQAIAHIDLPGPDRQVRFGEISALLDGSAAPGPSEVVARLTSPGGMHPPAYYWALNAAVRIGGCGRVWLSLPMIALGILTLLAFRRLTRAVVPVAGAGEFGLALMALSPWFVGYSVLARPYAAALCLAVLSTEALVRSLSGSRRAFAAFLILSTVGLYSLYHYAFVCGWQVTWLAAYALTGPAEARRVGLQRIATALVVWTLAYLPWMPHLLHHLEVTAAGKWYFSGAVALHEWPARAWYLGQVFGLNVGRVFGWNRELFHEPVGVLVAAGAILTASFIPLFARSLRAASPTRGDRASHCAFVASGVVPVAILLADIARGTHTLFLSKTSFVLLPIGLICLTRAWGELPGAAARRAGVALWLALFLAANVLALEAQTSRSSAVTRLADGISQTDGANHVIVLSSASIGYAVPFLLALRGAGVADVRVEVADSEARIEGVLRELGEHSDVWRVTVIDFSIPWEQTSWDEERLRRFARTARSLGWRIGSLDEPSPPATEESRVVTIASPVWVRFYSR